MEAGDEQLMLAYREGDAGAFEQLYKRHKDGLYRLVLRSIRDRALAEFRKRYPDYTISEATRERLERR